MIAAAAMLFVAQAVTPCTTAGLPRLGGGAVLIRPVNGATPPPFVQLGPTTSVVGGRDRIRRTSAEPVQQCEAVISIA